MLLERFLLRSEIAQSTSFIVATDLNGDANVAFGPTSGGQQRQCYVYAGSLFFGRFDSNFTPVWVRVMSYSPNVLIVNDIRASLGLICLAGAEATGSNYYPRALTLYDTPGAAQECPRLSFTDNTNTLNGYQRVVPGPSGSFYLLGQNIAANTIILAKINTNAEFVWRCSITLPGGIVPDSGSLRAAGIDTSGSYVSVAINYTVGGQQRFSIVRVVDSGTSYGALSDASHAPNGYGVSDFIDPSLSDSTAVIPLGTTFGVHFPHDTIMRRRQWTSSASAKGRIAADSAGDYFFTASNSIRTYLMRSSQTQFYDHVSFTDSAGALRPAPNCQIAVDSSGGFFWFGFKDASNYLCLAKVARSAVDALVASPPGTTMQFGDRFTMQKSELDATGANVTNTTTALSAAANPGTANSTDLNTVGFSRSAGPMLWHHLQ